MNVRRKSKAFQVLFAVAGECEFDENLIYSIAKHSHFWKNLHGKGIVLMQESTLCAKDGMKDGFPIFLGYFTTALAFGLLTRTSGLTLVQGVLISLTNYAGSGQFLMMNLYNAGSFLFEIALSVFFINSRYIFMSASLYPHLIDKKSVVKRILIGFGVTDENFAVSSLKGKMLPFPYMMGLIFTAYSGWVSGTFIGFVAGNFLPPVVQKASVITVYAMFASLLGGEVRRNAKALLVLLVSGLSNSVFILLVGIPTGFSFLLSMLLATAFACFIYTDEEVFGV